MRYMGPGQRREALQSRTMPYILRRVLPGLDLLRICREGTDGSVPLHHPLVGVRAGVVLGADSLWTKALC